MEKKKLGQAGWLIVELLLIVSFAGLLAQLAMDRAAQLHQVFGPYVGCDTCLTYPVVIRDLPYLATLFGLYILSWCICRYWLCLILRLIVLVGVGIYLADVAVMKEFFTRLNLADIRAYGEHLPLVWGQVQLSGFFLDKPWWMLYAVISWLGLALLAPSIRHSYRGAGLILLIIPVLGIGGAAVASPPTYVHDWAFRNVISANLTPGVQKPYSRQFKETMLSEYSPPETVCRNGLGSRKNIVLLILESWSPYQSKLLTGMNDWTPELDRLAEENTYFSQFHAGGFSTNEGLISIHGGLDFIAPAKSFFHMMPFETAWELEKTLPQALAENGYRTAFLTSGNLSFSRKGKWLASIGFDYIEGHDHPDYEGHKRFHFDSVPDDVLYTRSLAYLREQRSKDNPLFMVIETVSTHSPVIHPYTGERSSEAVFRYMDETVGDFYRSLEDDGFFEEGMLIIVSDHRAMVPIYREESDVLGQKAASLIPAVVIGSPAPKGQIKTPFHQSDLLPSLAALTSEHSCQAGPYRNIFDPDATEPRCLYHARGDNRDHLDVFCPEGSAVVELQGDNTSLIHKQGISSRSEESILREVNTHRIIGDERTRQLIESGYFD